MEMVCCTSRPSSKEQGSTWTQLILASEEPGKVSEEEAQRDKALEEERAALREKLGQADRKRHNSITSMTESLAEINTRLNEAEKGLRPYGAIRSLKKKVDELSKDIQDQQLKEVPNDAAAEVAPPTPADKEQDKLVKKLSEVSQKRRDSLMSMTQNLA